MNRHQKALTQSQSVARTCSVVNVSGHAKAHLGDTISQTNIIIDINGVVELISRLCNRCKAAPERYCNISQELNSLHAVLKQCEEVVPCKGFHDARSARLSVILGGFAQLLEELEVIVQKYEEMSLQQKRNWDRLKRHSNDINEIRARITSHASMLTAFLSASQARIEQKPDTILIDFQRGNLDGSVVSSMTLDSLDHAEREQWKLVQRQFEEHGITPEMFMEDQQTLLDLAKDENVRCQTQDDTPIETSWDALAAAYELLLEKDKRIRNLHAGLSSLKEDHAALGDLGAREIFLQHGLILCPGKDHRKLRSPRIQGIWEYWCCFIKF